MALGRAQKAFKKAKKSRSKSKSVSKGSTRGPYRKTLERQGRERAQLGVNPVTRMWAQTPTADSSGTPVTPTNISSMHSGSPAGSPHLPIPRSNIPTAPTGLVAGSRLKLKAHLVNLADDEQLAMDEEERDVELMIIDRNTTWDCISKRCVDVFELPCNFALELKLKYQLSGDQCLAPFK